MRQFGLCLPLSFWLALASQGHADPGACADLRPPVVAPSGSPRAVRIDDLVKLRDIGPNVTYDARLDVLAVSPDKTRVAFQLRRAEPATNSYCLAMFVVPIKPDGQTIEVDTGGELIRTVQTLLGVTAYPSGYTEGVTPKWSPDGKSIAYLRRDKGITQAWRAMADGSGAKAVTHTPFDVEDVVWTADGTALRISGRPGLKDAIDDIEKEGREGYLYDDRFMPLVAAKPFPRNTIPSVEYRVTLSDGTLQPVSGNAAAGVSEAVEGAPADAGLVVGVVSAAGPWLAWTKPEAADNVTAPRRLQVRSPDGDVRTCADEVCTGIVDIWWGDSADTLYFMRREGWRTSQTGLYQWQPGGAAPQRLLLTDDVLMGCKLARLALICAEEGSVQPRRLVQIDLTTGLRHVLFDPNPEFGGIRLGPVQRLYWKNAQGLEAFGDLVLPPDHRPGQHHPLIVVQYDSRGFLRGGTDDEYPIQLFAAQGFAVLSFHHPRTIGASAGAKTWAEVNRLNHQDWADRKSIQSALEAGLKAAIATGMVDPDHMGITGVSDGSNMLQFALVNSDLFQAAASSSCCEDPGTLLPLSGLNGAKMMTDMGYPRLTDNGETFWSVYSLKANADRIRTPLLMQSADSEYLAGLETFTALRERGTPVELVVYPDEYHEKWQPSHRLAVYSRNLDWFCFWLMGHEDPNPVKADQYARWRQMKSARGASKPISG